ncbi:MAG: hypothetical protein GTN93_07970, partial [Anaerolineae bacterium]|nr:hypothetical protein [Anaerolineae bacterium]
MAQLKRIERQKLEVAARLVSGGIEFNFEKLQGMGADDATMQVKGLIVHQALLHMERRRMLSGGL